MTAEQSRTAREILRRAVRHLVACQSAQGHFGDVRSTALACWALQEILTNCSEGSGGDFGQIVRVVADSRAWLAGQSKREEGGLSWESEAWDTALAVLALAPEPVQGERLDLATAWLRKISDPHTGSWCDEIWETILTATALLRRENLLSGPRNTDTAWLERTLQWICTIPSKPSGEFVCPHYSGFIVWLRNEIQRAQCADRISNRQALNMFMEKTAQAEDWLLDVVRKDGAASWSSYTFANSYILYAIATGAALSRLEMAKVVLWFERHQGQHGGFEDVEDTALAVLALGTALSQCGIPIDSTIAGMSPGTSQPPMKTPKCFFGYSSASKAVAMELKEFLSQSGPALAVKDWRWEFGPGQHLFTEIESVSRECQLAIFLAMKDDLLSNDDGTVHSTPRDNVVFEIGFFAARIGMANTLLIVEEGAKLPTDLGGILHIPLLDRRDLSSVKLHLLSTIQRIFSDCCERSS